MIRSYFFVRAPQPARGPAPGGGAPAPTPAHDPERRDQAIPSCPIAQAGGLLR